jgi:hypothetical protein
VAYNYESDPGVLIEIDEDSYSAESLQTLLEDTKTGIERVEKPLDIESFIYEKARNIKECAQFQKGSPTMVKITKLADGTVAIGLATSRVFTDATGFYLIMSLWSKAYRGQEFNAPVYDPREVDNACQAKEPTRILGDVRPKLYDLFTSKELLPGPSGSIIRAIGRLFRWAEPFELNIDKTSLIFNFTPDQIESIYQAVAADCNSKISHMDALLGYFWTCITKSRNLQGDKPIELTQVVGIRPRLSPEDKTLYDNHLGCFAAYFTLEINASTTASEKAMKLRQMTNSFGADRIAQHYKMLSKQFCR